jgi:hypothetical protein
LERLAALAQDGESLFCRFGWNRGLH